MRVRVTNREGKTVELNDREHTRLDFDTAQQINGVTATERCEALAFMLGRNAAGGPFQYEVYYTDYEKMDHHIATRGIHSYTHITSVGVILVVRGFMDFELTFDPEGGYLGFSPWYLYGRARRLLKGAGIVR